MIDEDGSLDGAPASPSGSENGAEPTAFASDGYPAGKKDRPVRHEVVRSEVDQEASERDQTAAEADQTSSDSDQTSSERDEAQAEADQRISNRDQATADRDRAARPSEGRGPDDEYELSRAERMTGTLARNITSEQREASSSDRLEHATSRDTSARARDQSAEARDHTAAGRDLMAEEIEARSGSSEGAATDARDRTAGVRARAAEDRARAARDRERAAADRAEAAEERARAREELMSAQAHTGEVVGQLAGGIAHNFNNLLAIVLLYAQQLMARAEAASGQEDLEQIVVAADRGAEITRQMLAFAGLSKSGRSSVEPSGAIRRLEPRLTALMSAGIGIELHLDPREPNVMLDAAEFDHIVMNLALNARDAMPGGGTVTIVCASEEVSKEQAVDHGAERGRYVKVSVSDTGTGVSSDVRGRIFEPFFTTKGQESTGLGLATVQGVVDRAGGWIDVQSASGRGTTLCMMLPEAVIATALG